LLGNRQRFPEECISGAAVLELILLEE